MTHTFLIYYVILFFEFLKVQIILERINNKFRNTNRINYFITIFYNYIIEDFHNCSSSIKTNKT